MDFKDAVIGKLDPPKLEPIKHLTTDTLFDKNILEALLEDFPLFTNRWWQQGGDKGKKLEMGSISKAISPLTSEFIAMLKSQDFCKLLQNTFDTPELIGVSRGGGPHMTMPGHFLDHHIDWMRYENKYYRWLNLHVYLNKGWTPGAGGELEVSDSLLTKIADPYFGNTAIYFSSLVMHGHSNRWMMPTPRKAITVFYFSEEPAPNLKLAMGNPNFRILSVNELDESQASWETER